jgi:hypothetical protein
MFAILHMLGMFVADLFKPRSRLEAENLFLRHQLHHCFAAGATSSSSERRSNWESEEVFPVICS